MATSEDGAFQQEENMVKLRNLDEASIAVSCYSAV
jgi:hypothetical protein